MANTLAEDLLLLALEDDSGDTGWTHVNPGLVGALLVDLGRVGAVKVAGDKLEPVPGVVAEHPVLARALAVLAADRPRTAKDWVSRLPGKLKPLVASVAAPLVERGVLTERHRKIAGLFPTTRFPSADPGPERELRSRLRAVLLQQQPPTEHDELLVNLLLPLGLVEGLVDRTEKDTAVATATRFAQAGVAGSAVGDAVREIREAVLFSGVLASVTASTAAVFGISST